MASQRDRESIKHFSWEDLAVGAGFLFRTYIIFWLILISLKITDFQTFQHKFIGVGLLILAIWLLYNSFTKKVGRKNYIYYAYGFGFILLTFAFAPFAEGTITDESSGVNFIDSWRMFVDLFFGLYF